MSGSFKTTAADDRRKATEKQHRSRRGALDTSLFSGQSNKSTGNERPLCLSVGGCSTIKSMSDTTDFDPEAVPEDEQSSRGRNAYTLDLNNEDELQEWLVEGFESNGWDVIREVSPDHSNYRVDLLCIHPKFGRVGIETKYVRPGEGGKKIAQAHQQITQQYWNKKYWGDKILLWALCPYFSRAHLDDPDRYNRTKSSERSQFTREFFAHYGIGYLNPSKGYNLIDYNHSVNERKIPAFSVNDDIPWRYYEHTDIEELRETVREKRGVEFE